MLYIVLNAEELRTKLAEVLKKADEEYHASKVLLYYAKNSTIPVLSMDAVQSLFKMTYQPQFIACPGTEDALNMEIASDIGHRIGKLSKDDEASFLFISNDTHYTHLINFWTSREEFWETHEKPDMKHVHVSAFIGPVLGIRKNEDAKKEPTKAISSIPEDPWLDDAERQLVTGY